MKKPERIVCLTEETTELLYLLGEEARIAGITAYTVRPARAKEEKPVVSAFISGSISKIQALNPDLIIGFSDIQADFARDLIKEGHNVLITNQRSIEEIFDTMRLVGRIVEREHDTERLIGTFQQTMNEVRLRSLHKRPVRVFFQEWNEPLITGIRWVSELIEIAGGQDCFGDLRHASMAKDRIVSEERAASSEPEVILASWCGKPVDFDWIRSRPSWKDMPALRQDALFEIDSSLILQPGPALFLEGIQEIERCLDNARGKLRRKNHR